MKGSHFDVLFVGDARFPGGTSGSLLTEIEASWRAGYATGFLQINSPVLKRYRPFHPGIRAAIEAGQTSWIDPGSPIECGLALIEHPTLFSRALELRPRIRAEKVIIICHHPPRDGMGRIQYDLGKQVEAVQDIIGLCPEIAPVSPVVRAQLSMLPLKQELILTPFDWHNLLNTDDWPVRPFRSFKRPLVIGRHSRPDKLKWPDTADQILAAYPNSGKYHVRVLGAGGFLRRELGFIPPNWELLDFGECEPKQFLSTLDAYVYFHSSQWIEAFGRNVLEALATGLPTVLPRSFKPLFGDGALYGNPEDVTAIFDDLLADPARLKEQSQFARFTVESKYSAKRFIDRLTGHCGLTPTSSRTIVSGSRPPKTIMFFTSNGVGLGHLTRSMAIAHRLKSELRPVFFTLSRAAKLVSDAGFYVEHASFHRYLKSDQDRWNAILAAELMESMMFHRPSVLIFDGNMPYQGLLNAIREFPQCRTVWMRRAMWRDHHGEALSRSGGFDAIIEPGELAAADDRGPTMKFRDQVVQVNPVLFLEPNERLGRREARQELGVGDRERLVALNLGSGNNFRFEPIRKAILAALRSHTNVRVLDFVSPLAEAVDSSCSQTSEIKIDIFPLFKYSTAFDCLVSAAGYNSFHEGVLGAIPTIFVPNTAEEMDRQDVRAHYAERMGLSIYLAADDIYAAQDKIDAILDTETAIEMQRRCGQIEVPTSGASEIANFIEELAYSCRSTVT